MSKIRPARPGDVPAIARIHVTSWQSAYRGILEPRLLDGLRVEDRLPLWEQWIVGAAVRVWVAEGGDGVEGFCRFCPARDIANAPSGFAEVTHLYVAPGRTRGGQGRALLAEALRFARAEAYAGLLLWVLEENLRARAFYESMGLAADGARHDEPDWLGPGVFEVRYRKDFAPGGAPRAAGSGS